MIQLPPALRPVALALLVPGFVAGLPAAALAQDAPAPHVPSVLEAGQRIQARSGSVRILGTLVGVDGDILRVRPRDQPELTLDVPYSRLEALSVWACCDGSRSFFRGALAGMGAAVFGGAVAQLLQTGDDPDAVMGPALVLGVPAGFVLGGLLGRTLFQADGWIDVPVPGRPDGR